MRVAKQIIWSRALTSTGDQAWDFAVPITLAVALPGRLDLVALTFFATRLGHLLVLPLVGTFIDRHTRLRCLRVGLGMQFVGIVLQIAAFFCLSRYLPFALVIIVVGGIMSSVGSVVMSIAVVQDLVPTLFQGHELTKINGHLRQVELFSEVITPVAAGGVLLVGTLTFPLGGLLIVALWNLISFVPEYVLLMRVCARRATMLHKPSSGAIRLPIWRQLNMGWQNLAALAIAPAIAAYTMLWFSVLSPHGVLLTTFLKESWHLPELTLGVFRGLGAVFGLSATLGFPWVVRRWGLILACRFHILLQALMVLASLVAFYQRAEWTFLAAILLSRVGLYGFMLGEQELRQVGIPAGVRGSVNATANAFTSIASLVILGLASTMGEVNHFVHLVEISVAFVLAGALLFWYSERRLKTNISQIL